MPSDAPSDVPFVLYFLLTIFYGCVNSLISPALPDLQVQASPPLTSSQLGNLFVMRGIGSMSGALVVGMALDKVDSSSCWRQVSSDPLSSTHLLLAICLLVRLCAAFTMPMGRTLPELGLNLAVVAFCSNAVYVCGSSGVSKTYGKLLGPRVSLMDAAYGVGGVLAPMLAEAVEWLGFGSAVQGYRVLSCVDLVLLLFTLGLLILGRGNALKANEAELADLEVKLPGTPQAEATPDSEQVAEEVDFELVSRTCALTFCVDVCYSSAFFWCFTYATRALKMSTSSARTINSLLFFMFTAVQFLWAFLQRTFPEQCDARTILSVIIPTAAAMAAGIGIGVGGESAFHNKAISDVAPVCLVLLGLGGGMNALFIAVLRQRTAISGKAFGFLRISSACGNMFGGALVGWFEPRLGLGLAMPSVELAGMGVAMMVFFCCAARATVPLDDQETKSLMRSSHAKTSYQSISTINES